MANNNEQQENTGVPAWIVWVNFGASILLGITAIALGLLIYSNRKS